MIDIGSIQAAGASLLTAADIAKSLLNLKISSEAQAKVIELQREIMAAQSRAMTAQSDQFSLVERVRDLEKQVADFEAWEAEKQRYELKQLATGFVAYVLKQPERSVGPAHAICTNCYERRFKSILQSNGQVKVHDHAFICPSCKARFACQSRNMDKMIEALG